MSRHEILFGRQLRITLDTLVSHMKDTELSEGLDVLIEQHKNMLREIRQVVEKRYRDKVATRQKLTLKSRDVLSVCQWNQET